MPTAILRPYFLGIRNRLFVSKDAAQNTKRYLLLLFTTALIMLCIFVCVVLAFAALAREPIFVSIIPKKALELLFYAFFFLLLISNTIAAIGNFYTAERMSLLLSVPVSSFRLYTAKFLETWFETSSMFAVLCLPIAFGYMRQLDLPISFIVKGVLVSIPFLLIPVGISVVLATLFVKLSSLVWKGGRSLALALGLSFCWVIYNIMTAASDLEENFSGLKALVRVLSIFENPSALWSPSRWPAELLSATLSSSTASFFFSIPYLLLLCTALASFALGFLAFDVFGMHVRSSAESQDRKKADQSRFDAISAAIADVVYAPFQLDQPTRAIILKDLRTLVRDRAQALQLLLYCGIAFAYIALFKLMTVSLNITGAGIQAWNAFLSGLNVLFAGFVLTTVMTRLVYPSISLEGKAFWLVLVSPLELRSVLRAKFFCWLPFSMLMSLTLLFAGAYAINASFDVVLTTAIIGTALSTGCTGLAIGLGSYFASFEWESPNQISTSLGTLVLLFCSISLVVITTIPSSTIIAFLVIEPLATHVGLWKSYALMCLSLFLVIFLNFFVFQIFCRRGSAALETRIKTM